MNHHLSNYSPLWRELRFVVVVVQAASLVIKYKPNKEQVSEEGREVRWAR